VLCYDRLAKEVLMKVLRFLASSIADRAIAAVFEFVVTGTLDTVNT
jgi:hypothetical protein